MLDGQAVMVANTAAGRGDLESYDRDLRRRTLTLVIVIALAGSLILGLFDLQFQTWVSVFALWGMALLCVPTLLLVRRGNYTLAAALLSLILLVVITVNLYDGDGVRDPGLVAYPIFIMLGALFFGKRAAPFFAVAAIASIAMIVALEVSGRIHPTVGRTDYGILVPLATLLAGGAGLVWAIVNNLENHLQRAAESEAELNKNYDLTLEAWARVMEHRDLETEGHSRRLVVLGMRLARALGMSESDILHLKRGALLHDIGKLSIPDQILRKPGPLDETERKVMQKHPVYATEMLAGIPFLQHPLAVAHSHHERWDGRGYPDGLKGEEIPLAARLFSVIDVWDALSSERVYRPAWPKEKVVAYLKENAGTQFDPRVVEAFLRIMGE
jgi:hypothetical protein